MAFSLHRLPLIYIAEDITASFQALQSLIQQLKATNSMELEPIEFFSNYNFFSSETSYALTNEFPECSRGNSSSYQSEDSLSHHSIQEGSFLDGESIHGLLQMEMVEEALEFNPDFNMNQKVAAGMGLWEPDDDILPREEESSYFKGIQAELMEENSLTDLLLAAAEAVEAQNQLLASDLIGKLKNLLFHTETEGVGSSFNRLASFFTQGLHYKSVNIAAEMADDQENACPSDNTMSAFQLLQELSPFIKFAHFTANQAILEAAKGEKTLHVVDFDIMEGIQWPPLMADLAAREDACLLRLTAIIHGHGNERKIQQTGRRLCDFAESINFPFMFDQMVIEKEEDFEKLQVGQTLIANLSGISRHVLSHSNLSKLKTFLGGITKLSPKCVVLVEEELFKISIKTQSMSFVEFFFEAFHHFSALSDSLLRCFSGTVYENGFRQIEQFLGTRILDSVSQFPCEKNVMNRMLWRDAIDSLKEYKKIPLSSFNYSQAKYLVSLFRGDFWVKNEKCRLTLCWKSRPLCTATIWVPNGRKN